MYAAEHVVLGTRVALKVLLPEVALARGMVERFVQEARAASEIGSSYIPRCFDFGTLPSGEPYTLMEYVEGETWAERLARRGPAELPEAVGLLRQVAEAVAQAHAAGIVHRDLKPNNLLVVAGTEARPQVKVLDFGIARTRLAEGSGRLTTIGMVLGTPTYCAPEQACGEDVGPAADVYALGATAFELLTGHPPFEGSTSEVLGAKTTQDAPLIRTLRPDLPAVVEATLRRMLARDPGGRPASMQEVLALLDRWPVALAPAVRLRPARRWPHLARRAALVAGVAATALVLGLLLWVWPRPPGAPRTAARPPAPPRAASARAVGPGPWRPGPEPSQLLSGPLLSRPVSPRPEASSAARAAPGSAQAGLALPRATEPRPGQARATRPSRATPRATPPSDRHAAARRRAPESGGRSARPGIPAAVIADPFE